VFFTILIQPRVLVRSTDFSGGWIRKPFQHDRLPGLRDKRDYVSPDYRLSQAPSGLLGEAVKEYNLAFSIGQYHETGGGIYHAI
jgi:hypothetical protein